jgi:protein-S-isoprenylcysteine O-methyltransferase Ste14
VWWREIGLRLLIFVGVLGILRLSSPTGPFPGLRSFMVNSNPLLGVTGAAICALGMGFAIWARVYLGRNWGMPMSQKEQPEITTTGPYAYVRHPIYAGFLLAMLGSAVGQTFIWLVPFVVVGVYFTYSARREEKLMLQQFPEAYRAYMRTTKMLVPFIW